MAKKKTGRQEVEKEVSTETNRPERKKNKKKHTGIWVTLLIILLLILILLVAGYWALQQVKTLKSQAYELKDDMKTVASAMVGGDADAARTSLGEMRMDAAAVEAKLQEPLFVLAAKVPGVGQNVTDAGRLVELADQAAVDMLAPAIEVLDQYPLASLKGGEGSRLETVTQYLSLMDELIPKASALSTEMQKLDLGLADRDGSIAGYISTFGMMTELMEEADNGVIRPTLGVLEEYPLSGLKSGGDKMEIISAYLELMDEVLPEAISMTDKISAMDLSEIDPEGKLQPYLNLFTSVTELLQKAEYEVMRPTMETLEANPLTELKSEDRSTTEMAEAYLALMDEVLPKAIEMSNMVVELDLSLIDEDGKITAKLSEYQSFFLELAELLQDAETRFINPLMEQQKAMPLKTLKADGGFNVNVAISWLDLVEPMLPELKEFAVRVEGMDLSRVDFGGKATAIQKKLPAALELCEMLEPYLPLVRALIGDGSDRTYFMVAQNSAEIRAGGGFPGSAGLIEVRDGILTVGDFSGILGWLNETPPASANITMQELTYISAGLLRSWDVEYFPHFTRYAPIWADAVQAKKGIHIDGVISMTPAVIQQILGVLGEIELSDGTVLNGTNATIYLQHDIYKYLDVKDTQSGNATSDKLFAETAKLTMAKLLSFKMSLSQLKELVGIFEDDAENRIVMMWMRDSKEQAVVKELGLDCDLNRDPQKPWAGVYYSGANASKLGWYMDIVTEWGEPVTNANGSQTYDMTVTITNTFPANEVSKHSWYIRGNYGGSSSARVMFFAPAGGSVSDFKTTSGEPVKTTVYSGLQMGALWQQIYPGKSVTITYKLTTAPGVSTPLKLSTTPSLREYRLQYYEENPGKLF